MKNIRFFQRAFAILLLLRAEVLAFDPTEVNGSVTVEVDRSKPVWSVTVTNHSADNLTYEMMDKVPRGLGMEVWVDDETHGGLRIHAENLAFMTMDIFPADLRAIEPGKSETFQLDPTQASILLETENDEVAIELLLNGAPLETTRMKVTEEQRKEFSEYGIP